MTDRPTVEQIIGWNRRAELLQHGHVIVHPDDVLDWLERLSVNPLGTPIYTELTPAEAHEDFMTRFGEDTP